MRILLDECLPRRLRQDLPGHELKTVPEAGWAGQKNGDLLRLAAGSCDVLLTVDASFEFQQNVNALAIAVIALHADRLWAIGGRRSVNGNPDDLVAVNDTWVTADGVTWERLAWDLDWPFRLYYGVASWDGKLWLIGGGEGGDDGERNDVWTSTDGAHWELFEAEAPWTGRFAMSTVIHRDKLFMFAGKEGPEQFLNDVWSLERSER